ncbi:TPA: hypothetical protein J8W34_003052 [Citrobacter koseri]|nr:hypothetical protein [Citrobacter koseri]HBA1380926.1 hypothetical protein [Citrobacter koseri]
MSSIDKRALKPGTYAILFRDNWEGEDGVYEGLATLSEDFDWYDRETGNALVEGIEVLKAWPLDDGSNMLALLDELEAKDKRIAELSGEFFALPPLNDELITILGRPNFTCAHLAELLSKGGQDIRRKAECEQAAVIYWFLDLYLKYGDRWESIAKDDIQSRVAMVTAGTAKGE